MIRRLSILVVLVALLSGCTGWMWGGNSFGQLGNGTDTVTYTVPTQEASASRWLVLAAGGRATTCGIKADRSLWCWGNNTSGQVGNGIFGSGEHEISPVEVGAGITWDKVFPGYNHTCAIDTDRQLWCWGLNGNGQLGLGDTNRRTTPTQVGTATNWRVAGLMYRSTCAINTADEMYCFGQNSAGQLGLGDTAGRSTPTQVSGSWSTLDGGQSHACAINTASDLYCWGRNEDGQLAYGIVTDYVHTPSLVKMEIKVYSPGEYPSGYGWENLHADKVDWTAITAGDAHTCGLFEEQLAPFVYFEFNNNLSCWGDGANGQLGDDSGAPEVPGYILRRDKVWVYDWDVIAHWGLGWSRVTAGRNHTCGIRKGNGFSANVFCWGIGEDGQLGHGSTNNYQTPVLASDTNDWVRISAGLDYTVGTREPN